MSKYTIELTPEIHSAIKANNNRMTERIGDGSLPPYPAFVNNLFKEMASAHDELHHAGTGIASEAGEILDITKKVWVYRKPLDVLHLLEELGDLRYYYQAALNMLGLKDEDIVAENMNKLSVRYADGKYSNEQAIARADKGQERRFMSPDAAPSPIPVDKPVDLGGKAAALDNPGSAG